MRARIHRGAAEVGGNCVELESQGQRIVLDIGRPLAAGLGDEVPLPPVAGFAAGPNGLVADETGGFDIEFRRERDPPEGQGWSMVLDYHDQSRPLFYWRRRNRSLLGVIISHGHPDHYGLVGQLHPEIPVYIGEAAARIINEAAFFGPLTDGIKPRGFLVDHQRLELGPFGITPYLIDHSAFDAYSLLVEADDSRLLYTGDLRAHGRKPATFDRLTAEAWAVDVLLMEGTRVGRASSSHDELTEQDVEDRCADLCSRSGLVLAMYSSQNIDRYVSMYKAARRSGREFVIDLYTAAIANATGRDSIPQPSWDGIRVFVPHSQRVRVKRAGAFVRTDGVRDWRIYPEELAERRSDLVMTFRRSMAGDMERAGCLDGASAIWSMWAGYLEDAAGKPLEDFLRRNEIPMEIVHSSGHASVEDLKRLVAGVDPDRVVPIHTDAPERFRGLFGNVEVRRDGEWWDV